MHSEDGKRRIKQLADNTRYTVWVFVIWGVGTRICLVCFRIKHVESDVWCKISNLWLSFVLRLSRDHPRLREYTQGYNVCYVLLGEWACLVSETDRSAVCQSVYVCIIFMCYLAACTILYSSIVGPHPLLHFT